MVKIFPCFWLLVSIHTPLCWHTASGSFERCFILFFFPFMLFKLKQALILCILETALFFFCNAEEGKWLGKDSLSAAMLGGSVWSKSWTGRDKPYYMNTSENQWYELLPKFFYEPPLPIYRNFPALQLKYSKMIPRLFVNLSPPLLEQFLSNIFVFSTERWFPRGFRPLGCPDNFVLSVRATQARNGRNMHLFLLIKRRAPVDNFEAICRLCCG